VSAPTHLSENVTLRAGDPDVPVLVTCEHASRALPADADLGVAEALLESHWGWDRWAEDVLLRFAPGLGITTLSARLSRLLIDVNRGVEDDTLIRSACGDAGIPGNVGLSQEEIRARIERFHTPYHDAVDQELQALVSRCRRERVLFFTFHSFSPEFGEQNRDFDVGVLFDSHEDLAAGVKRALATAGLRTRLNEPYSGYRGEIYSAAVHGEAHEVAYFEIELNQGVLEDPRQRRAMADVFRQVIPAICPEHD
jgi:predicted N-formylglutamate amidohydrolase